MKLNTLALVLVMSPILLDTGTAQIESPQNTESHGDPFTPVGKMQVTPLVVQPGVHPSMTWEIDYPKSIPDLAVIVPPGKLVTTNDKPQKLQVRIAGVSMVEDENDVPVALWIRTSDSGQWELLFYGREDEVDASEVLFQANVNEGTEIDFAARSQSPTGGWSATQWTLSASSNVTALIQGDPVPTDSYALTNGVGVESYLTQFVDDEGDQIVAGPRDIIHLFELDGGSPGESSFDLQDLVIVTTVKDNNGHGNNLDGVDVSNPGQGGGGPNGDEDPSGYIDDEKKWIKKKNNN